MRAAATLALFSCFIASPAAGDVTFPLTVDYPVLAASLRHELDLDGGKEAVLWGTLDGCRYLVVQHVDAARAAERVRLRFRGRARLGFGILGFCFSPLHWDGFLDSLATPTIGNDWQLRFRDLESSLLDAKGERTTVGSRLWDVVRSHFEERLERFHVDLAPPLDDATNLISVSVPPERAAPVIAALRTIRPAGVRVDDEGVKVDVSLDLPPAPPTVSVPEAPLDPAEIMRWQSALESWDGFLVFVVKDLGLDADPEMRDALFDLLMGSRHALVAALASPPSRGVDPVRKLFLQSWEHLRVIVRHAAAEGRMHGHAARYAAFMAAGDALAALDAAAPSLGLEISADGLRRLARILDPELATDPLAYSEAPDAALRELFRFHEPESGPPPTEPPPPPGTWWWLGPSPAYADVTPPAGDLPALARRLDRWVPDTDHLAEYRDTVNRLLENVGSRERDEAALPEPFRGLFLTLVRSVAWQESCWRQFVARSGNVTFLLSSTGDVGIMQVNRRVWRGFFDVQKLEWDIAYNTGAGSEILAQLLGRYGPKEGAEDPRNAARSTYAAYNGGPGAYRRYRSGRVPRRQRAIDRAFWEKYQAMASGRALDFVLCIEKWGRPSRTQLSTVRPGSTSKRSISSRSARATSARSCRHASIAFRPRARFV